MRAGGFVAFLLSVALGACSRSAPPAYDTSLDMKEVMDHVVDPGAWAFWRASGTVETEHGEESLTPKTEEGWIAAESGAAEVAEAGNLLRLPSRSRGETWNAFAAALTRDGLAGKAAAEAHDAPRMFTSGADIYQVCTACHAAYVMPFLPKETRRLPGLPEWPAEVRAKQRVFSAHAASAAAPASR